MLVPAAAAHARTSVVEVQLSGPSTVATLERLGFDVTHDVDMNRARLLLHSDEDRRRLAAAGFPSREVVADVEAATRDAREADRRVTSRGVLSAVPSGRTSYRHLSDYEAELAQLAAENPTLVRPFTLPRESVEGRAIRGVEIASDVTRDDDGRPAYVVMGVHHAREWPSGEVSMEFALDLVQNYGTDERITDLLDRVRVLVVPVVNPDGFIVSRGEVVPPTPPTKPLQRKNCRVDDSGTAEPCALRDAVDLNRNYGAYWGGNGASTDATSDTYRGPGPWSEPETQGVHELSQGLHITNFQSIHNIASLVLRPPGFKALGLAPDEERLKRLGDAMGRATGYSSEYGYQLYEVTGATEDWNYVAQNAFGYTIELGPAELSPLFQGPYQTHVVDQYLGSDGSPGGRDGVREALLLAGEQAHDTRDHAVIRGTAPPGSVLRLRKTFQTSTSPICRAPYGGGSTDCAQTDPAEMLDDGLDTQLTVPDSGQYVWHVNPSTRPFVRKAGGTEAWTLSCETAGGSVLDTRDLVIDIGEEMRGDPCTPGSRFVRTSDGGDGGGSSGGGSSEAPAVAPAPAPLPERVVPLPSPGPAPLPPAPIVRLAQEAPAEQGLATVMGRGVLARASCTVDCTLVATLRRSRTARASARLGTVLGRRTVRLRAGERRAFRVRLSRAARRYVARRGVRRLVLRLEARSGGVTRVRSRGVRLVRR